MPKTTAKTPIPADLIGTKTLYGFGELWVMVEILNARSNFGRVDVEITPVGGEGKKWVKWEVEGEPKV